MIRDTIFKPLPSRIHVAFWALYFSWITAVNSYKYGWRHLSVVFVAGIGMLAIAYANRALLRCMLFRKISGRYVLRLFGYFLLAAAVSFLALYAFPTELSRSVVQYPKRFRCMDFGIDFFTFYCTFALKGILILGVEVTYNLSNAFFRHLGRQRGESFESFKAQLFRNWIVHFMGNLTQSFMHLARKVPTTLMRFDDFLKLEAYGMRQLQSGGCIRNTLDDEIRYLRILMLLYGEKRITLKTDVSDLSIPILPMLLLSLYKNMVKHGDLSDIHPQATIQVHADDRKLTICCINSIADRSAWIFEAGGTGLEQLTKLLCMEYGTAFSLIKNTADGIFYLNLEILF